MANSGSNIFCLAILLLSASTQILGQETQWLGIYENMYCSRLLIKVTESNIIPLPSSEQTLYFLVSGLWSVSRCNDNACGDHDVERGVGNYCYPFTVGFGFSKLNITRYGDANMMEKKITLYSENNFMGDETVVTNNATFRTFSVRSLYFTGPYNWQVYSNANFEGESYCLENNINDDEQGVTYDLTSKLPFVVSSIASGCTETPSTVAPTTQK